MRPRNTPRTSSFDRNLAVFACESRLQSFFNTTACPERTPCACTLKHDRDNPLRFLFLLRSSLVDSRLVVPPPSKTRTLDLGAYVSRNPFATDLGPTAFSYSALFVLYTNFQGPLLEFEVRQGQSETGPVGIRNRAMQDTHRARLGCCVPTCWVRPRDGMLNREK